MGNNHDKYKVGTQPVGSEIYNSKLSEAEVRVIRSEYVPGPGSQKRLSERFGVDPNTIYNIVHRLTWRHI